MKRAIRSSIMFLLFSILLFKPSIGWTQEKSLDQGLNDISQKITESIPSNSKQTVAVMDFNDLQGNITMLGRFVSEELITRLFETKRFKVIERSLLEKALTELKFNTTDLVDTSNAKQLGKVVGADAIVTGTLSDLGQSVKINARVIMVESGEVIGAAGAQIVKDASMGEMMKKVVTQPARQRQRTIEKTATDSEQVHVSDADLPSGAVSYWKFDEGSGMVAKDTISKNDGTIFEATWTTSGISGNALNFNGRDSYVNIPNIINGWSQGTIEVWIKFTTTTPSSNGTAFFSTGQQPLSGHGNSLVYDIYPGRGSVLRWGLWSGRAEDALSGIIPAPNKWYHVVGTWGTNGIKIYVDGILRGTNPYKGPVPQSNFNTIGASSYPGTSFNGVIDEVVIYNRDLTAYEVAQRYKLYAQ